jgi:hypothetical protein
MRKNIHGSSKIGCLIWLVILWGVLFVGYKFGTAQWAYLSMKEDVQEIARGAAASPRGLNVEAIQNEVIRRGEILGISISPEDIRIEDKENEITLDVYWEVEFKFPFYTYYEDYSITTTKRKGL